MKRSILNLATALVILFAAGCDTTGDNGGNGAPSEVFVANQGNFGDGNGSVTVYDSETGQSRVAAITSLGSIVQSLAFVNGRLYVMSNSGDRIDVFDAQTLEQVAQISDVLSPRYLLSRGTTGYVTSLFGEPGSFSGGKVTVLDLSTHTKIDEIEVGDNPEGMALVGNRLHVANHGFGNGRTIDVIDTEARAVVGTIAVDCDGPRFLVADSDDEVIVLCTGKTLYDDQFNVIGETPGKIVVLDGATGDVGKQIDLNVQIGTVGPGQDAFLADAANRHFVVTEQETILMFDTESNTPLDVIGPFPGGPIGAVAFDARSDRLYLGRSNGFTEAGEVSIHGLNGAETGRFAAGIVPAFITFAPAE